MTGEHGGFPVINGIAINDFRFTAVEDHLFSPTRGLQRQKFKEVPAGTAPLPLCRQ